MSDPTWGPAGKIWVRQNGQFKAELGRQTRNHLIVLQPGGRAKWLRRVAEILSSALPITYSVPLAKPLNLAIIAIEETHWTISRCFYINFLNTREMDIFIKITFMILMKSIEYAQKRMLHIFYLEVPINLILIRWIKKNSKKRLRIKSMRNLFSCILLSLKWFRIHFSTNLKSPKKPVIARVLNSLQTFIFGAKFAGLWGCFEYNVG